MTPPPSNRQRGATLELKAWYTLREYAEATGQKFETVRRQATRGAIPVDKVPGKKERVILLSRLRAEYPDVWASLSLVAQGKPTVRK